MSLSKGNAAYTLYNGPQNKGGMIKRAGYYMLLLSAIYYYWFCSFLYENVNLNKYPKLIKTFLFKNALHPTLGRFDVPRYILFINNFYRNITTITIKIKYL